MNLQVFPADLVQQPHSLSAHFQEECRVSVAGLVSAPQHNGKTGHVHSAVDTHTGRLHVLLDDGHALNVKPANLVSSSAPLLQRASSAAPSFPSDDFSTDGLPTDSGDAIACFIEVFATAGSCNCAGLTFNRRRLLRSRCPMTGCRCRCNVIRHCHTMQHSTLHHVTKVNISNKTS